MVTYSHRYIRSALSSTRHDAPGEGGKLTIPRSELHGSIDILGGRVASFDHADSLDCTG